MPIDEVWEAWVDAFIADLAPRCGLVAVRRGHTRHEFHWRTSIASMRALVPDTGLRGPGRMVWVDAKYKAHLQLLVHKGWSGLEQETRDAHRADLHQALACAAVDPLDRIDSVLAYPELSASDASRPAIATIAAGRRQVRLMLVGIPFGFRSADHRERLLETWRGLLTA